MIHTGKFKVAMVGISTETAKAYLSELFCSHTTKVIAVCDKNCKELQKICETYLINGYRTYENLIENEEIDFAIISIPKAV